MSQRLNRFWSALEQVPDLAAVPGEWRSLLGEEHTFVARFLRPTQRIARSARCTVPGRTCVHEIRPWKREYLSVCRDGCEAVTLSRAEVVVHRLDVNALGSEMSAALCLEAVSAEPVPNMAGVWRIGGYTPLAGYRFPVYVTFTGEPDVLQSTVDSLAARGEPSILAAPSRTALKQSTADVLTRARSCFLPLDELLGQGDSLLSLLDGHTAAGVFAEFRAVHVPEPQEDDGLAFFSTPAGTRWEDVSITFIDGETVSVQVGDMSRRLLFSEVGMSDGRSKKPTKQWDLLRNFADGHGVFDWRNRRADRKNQKRKENLADNLRRFFRIEGDPFEPDGDGWRARFAVSVRE